MNMVLKHWDDRVHRWEQTIAGTSHNLIHNEAFWAILIVSLMLISMILLAVFTRSTGNPPRNVFPTPFGYPYY